MRALYLKNYKGFSESYIELQDVNFLVGENSTGKTAILKLISILSSQEFWLYSEFNTTEVELGYFDEILNENAKERCFYIGLERTVDDDGTTKRFLFEVKGNNNIPQISRAKTTHDKYDIYMSFANGHVSYHVKESSEKAFKEWANDWDLQTRRGKRIKTGNKKLPFSFLMTLVEDELLKLNKEKKEVSMAKSGRFKAYPLLLNYLWIAPIRAKAKRTYESYKLQYSPEGEHIPFLLRKLLTKAGKNKSDKLLKYLEEFGKESRLFDRVDIKELGRRNSALFEINVTYHNTVVKLTNVGYGVSQALPLVIEILSSNDQEFSIQQPEVHLHPKAQAAFGSLLFRSFITNKNRFVVETHSDFTINRFRYELFRSKAKEKPSCQVLFFERGKTGTKFTSISIGKEGHFTNDVPMAYRDFFIDEELKLLEI